MPAAEATCRNDRAPEYSAPLKIRGRAAGARTLSSPRNCRSNLAASSALANRRFEDETMRGSLHTFGPRRHRRL